MTERDASKRVSRSRENRQHEIRGVVRAFLCVLGFAFLITLAFFICGFIVFMVMP